MGGPDKYLSSVYGDQALPMFFLCFHWGVCVWLCFCLPSPSWWMCVFFWYPMLVTGEDARVRAMDWWIRTSRSKAQHDLAVHVISFRVLLEGACLSLASTCRVVLLSCVATRFTYATKAEGGQSLRPWMLAWRQDFGCSGYHEPEQACMIAELMLSEGNLGIAEDMCCTIHCCRFWSIASF